jgi:hypothetical protein
MRHKKIEEKSIEAQTSGISHGSREVGRKTSSRRVKIKCTLRVIYAVTIAEDLLSFNVVISKANKKRFQSDTTAL